MHADLERVIALQRLDSTVQDARRRVADQPERLKVLDERLETARQRLAGAKERLAANQSARRSIEKELSVHQVRLAKFRDQLMSVKTNVEYQAMQKEIQFAQVEVKALEDKMLEGMLEADDLTSALKYAEVELAAEQKTVDAERKALAAEIVELGEAIERITGERAALVAALDPQVMSIFELVAKRRHGVAVAEARDGVCTICHVRLRPQVFNTVRRNDQIVQCESCNRILFFIPVAPPPADASPQPPS